MRHGSDWNEDGRTDEVFVIAPNRTIWHTGKNAGGGKEMSGNGRADDMLGANGTWHNWTTSG